MCHQAPFKVLSAENPVGQAGSIKDLNLEGICQLGGFGCKQWKTQFTQLETFIISHKNCKQRLNQFSLRGEEVTKSLLDKWILHIYQLPTTYKEL